ncbi:MAG TPA: hypothetical protein VFJ97_02810 [Dermatophilaceae bacterium]|nr:hypothetical protein [Dermatophilaceae bacterium]
MAASTGGTGGTVVSPAPSRAPRSRAEPVPTRRVVPVEPSRAEPSAVDANLLDARDSVDGEASTPAGSGAEDRTDGRAAADGGSDNATAGVAADLAEAAPSGAGVPQTSQ